MDRKKVNVSLHIFRLMSLLFIGYETTFYKSKNHHKTDSNKYFWVNIIVYSRFSSISPLLGRLPAGPVEADGLPRGAGGGEPAAESADCSLMSPRPLPRPPAQPTLQVPPNRSLREQTLSFRCHPILNFFRNKWILTRGCKTILFGRRPWLTLRQHQATPILVTVLKTLNLTS